MNNDIEKMLLNFNKEDEEKIDDIVSFLMKDPNHKYTTENLYFKLAENINESMTTIDDNQTKLTYNQFEIFNKMKKMKNIFLSCSTGFGKSWLSIKAATTLLKESKINNIVYITTSDSLSIQIESKIKKEFVDNDLQQINIDNYWIDNKKNIFVGTQEKVYFLTISKFDFSKTIFIADEAHESFGDDDRSKLYLVLLENISKTNLKCIWFLGAFLIPENFEKLRNKLNFKISNDNIYFLSGFKSLYTIDFENYIFLKDEEINKNQNLEKNNELITYKFFSSYAECSKKFNKKLLEKVKSKEIENNFINELENKDFVNKYQELIQKYKIDLFENLTEEKLNETYNVFNGLKCRIGIYHAKIPKEIRELISLASEIKTKKGSSYLKEIYITSAILGGVDFDIGKLGIKNLKINRSEMSISTFFNLAGRVGRYRKNKKKKIGIIKIESTDDNKKWVNKNHKFLLSRNWNNYNNSDQMIKNNHISENLELINKEEWLNYKDYFKIDPRISIKLTKEILENKNMFKKICQDILKIYEFMCKGYKVKTEKNSFSNWTNMEILKYMEDFLKIYCSKEFHFHKCLIFDKDKYFNKEYNKQNEVLKTFIKYLSVKMNENDIFHNKVFGIKKSIKNNKNFSSKSFSERLDYFVNMFYQEIDYALIAYLNHFIELAKKEKLLNISLDDFRQKNGIFLTLKKFFLVLFFMMITIFLNVLNV